MCRDFSSRPDLEHSEARALQFAYGEWVGEKIKEGYGAVLVTFMFTPLGAGSQATQIDIMLRDIERVYSRLAHRFAHHPDRPSERHKLPLLIAAPDLPVFKYEKMALADACVNDGLHIHSILMQPPLSRFEGDLARWMRDEHRKLIYGTHIERFHVIQITHTPKKVTQYALKAAGTRLSIDSLLILPKALSERGRSTDAAYDEAVRDARGSSLMRTGRKPF